MQLEQLELIKQYKETHYSAGVPKTLHNLKLIILFLIIIVQRIWMNIRQDHMQFSSSTLNVVKYVILFIHYTFLLNMKSQIFNKWDYFLLNLNTKFDYKNPFDKRNLVPIFPFMTVHFTLLCFTFNNQYLK